MRTICYILSFILLSVCCTPTQRNVSNRAFVPLPIPINLKCYCYMDNLHYNIMDSVFFGHYYSNVELKNWRNFEIVDLVSGTLVRKTYTIGATDRFRAINGRISRLFLDEILENPAHRVALEYYLNGNRINSKADAFRLATLDWEIDDIIIEISDSRDTCKVNIVFH